MRDYSKKCLQLAIDELRKTCINKEYADKKIQYMNRYYGKLYTEEEILKEAQALINESLREAKKIIQELYVRACDRPWVSDEVLDRAEQFLKDNKEFKNG